MKKDKLRGNQYWHEEREVTLMKKREDAWETRHEQRKRGRRGTTTAMRKREMGINLTGNQD